VIFWWYNGGLLCVLVGWLMDQLQCTCSEVSICFRQPLLPSIYQRSAASAESPMRGLLCTTSLLPEVPGACFHTPGQPLTSPPRPRPLPNSPTKLLHRRRRRHNKVKMDGQTRDNTHRYHSVALPWIAKLPSLGIRL
jgi:hypothetical protein